MKGIIENMKFEHLTELVEKDIKNNNVPFLVGEAGIGKSSWVESLASKIGTKCFVLPVNQLADKADLTGCRLVPVGTTKNGEKEYAQVFYPHVVIRNAIKYAEENPDETPILFLDEINRTTPDVTSEALSIPTLRSIGNTNIPDNLKVIIAGNDKGNVCALDKASITRFAKYNMEPDLPTFINANPELNKYILEVLKKNPTYIVQEYIEITPNDEESTEFQIEFDDENMEQITVPRTISATSKWLNEFSDNELINLFNTATSDDSNVLSEAIFAHCGHTAFSLALLQEIADKLSKPLAAPVQNISLEEPAKYKDIIAFTSRDDINNFIAGLNSDEKSELFIYCLYDSRDNTQILECLAPAITSLNKQDTQNLTILANNHQLNDINYSAVSSMNCTLSQILNMMGI